MDCQKELKKRLSESYERMMKVWMTSPPAQLVALAEDIAAARFIRDSLTDAISDGDAAFLLTLDDPLELMSGKWVEENGSDTVQDEALRHCVYSLAYEHNADLEAFEEGGEMRLC